VAWSDGAAVNVHPEVASENLDTIHGGMPMQKLSSRVALVTGAASGIGRAIAEALAEHGAQVVVADLDELRGEQVAATIDGHLVVADLSDQVACRRAVDETVDRYGGIDILINNAGFQHVDPVQDFPVSIWNRMIAVMLTAPFLLTKYAWPNMQAQGWGRVINISSIHGLVASPFKSAYISAKHGLIGLTQTTALEGGQHGITVNAICPAYVRTPLVEQQIDDQARVHGISRDKVIEDVMLESAAIKRLIEPEEVAQLAVYLCSDAAGAITGSAITIDLGWTAE
jgi:3-hydroxybutyrate dehydrogenase